MASFMANSQSARSLGLLPVVVPIPLHTVALCANWRGWRTEIRVTGEGDGELSRKLETTAVTEQWWWETLRNFYRFPLTTGGGATLLLHGRRSMLMMGSFDIQLYTPTHRQSDEDKEQALL